jgi:hypothetical protein
MPTRHLAPTASNEDIVAVLASDGVAVIDRLAEPALMDRIRDEFTPFMAATRTGPDAFSGNLTSQFWANVYLDALDHSVKRELRCRHYVRYVDDLVLLSSSETELLGWRNEIKRFLGERLALRLRPGMEESSSGYSRTMSSAVYPLPRRSRTKSTVMQSPRIGGRPALTSSYGFPAIPLSDFPDPQKGDARSYGFSRSLASTAGKRMRVSPGSSLRSRETCCLA